jgi:hypothetical protein
MSLAINPGFDKSTCHGYQDCNVVTSARGCEDDTQRQSSQDRSVDHRYINSLLCKTPKTAGAPPLYVQSQRLENQDFFDAAMFLFNQKDISNHLPTAECKIRTLSTQ